VLLSKPQEVKRGRDETVDVLAEVFGVTKPGSVRNVIGRWRRMEEEQIERLTRWMRAIKAGEN
jgi:hypothetical protein